MVFTKETIGTYLRYESLNGNLRLVLLTQGSEHLSDASREHRILWESILLTVRLYFVVIIN
jgi:hypothetical protein